LSDKTSANGISDRDLGNNLKSGTQKGRKGLMASFLLLISCTSKNILVKQSKVLKCWLFIAILALLTTNGRI